MKPEQRKKRVEQEGKQAHIDGKEITENPYLTMGSKGKVYAGFWDKGFISDEKEFEYVDVIGEGFKGCINLFFDGQVVAMIRHVGLAEKIKAKIPEMKLYNLTRRTK